MNRKAGKKLGAALLIFMLLACMPQQGFFAFAQEKMGVTEVQPADTDAGLKDGSEQTAPEEKQATEQGENDPEDAAADDKKNVEDQKPAGGKSFDSTDIDRSSVALKKGGLLRGSETTSVNVTKEWNDGDAGDRPASVTVDLLANGQPAPGVDPLVLSAPSWTGTFSDLPKYDENNNEITYTIEETSVQGYVSDVIAVKVDDDGYQYPTNIYTGTAPDTSIKQTAKKKATLKDGGNSSIWSLQPGLHTDYIRNSQIVFNSEKFISSNAELREYDKHGTEITSSSQKVFVRSGNAILFRPGSIFTPDSSGKYTPDHYFTLKYKDAVTIMDGTTNGTTKDVTIRFDIRTLTRIYAKLKEFTVLEENRTLWIGNGSNIQSSMIVDMTLKIDGVDEGNVLMPFSDIDVTSRTPHESVIIYKDTFDKTIYTMPLSTGVQDTRTSYTLYRDDPDNDNWFYGIAAGRMQDNNTLRSGFLARGDLDHNGYLELRWDGPGGCSTAFFQHIDPFRWKTTLDGSIVPNNGGTISETLASGETLNAHEWSYRDYGDARLITIEPNDHYHISYIKIDGEEVDLNGFGNNGTQSLTAGWKSRGNTGEETVRLYQKADGVVEVYLPKQCYANSGGTVDKRVDHWVDAGFEPNGTVSEYKIVNTPETSFSGTKEWFPEPPDNHDNEDLVLKLYQKPESGGEWTEFPYDPDQIEWNGNTYTISGLPLYNKEKEQVVYKIEECEVAGYTTTTDGYDITNTLYNHTHIAGTKIWMDGGRQHNNAEEIVLTLKRSIEGSDPVVVEGVEPEWDDNDYIFKGLPLYDENYNEYTYTVEESLSDDIELDDGDSYISTTVDAAGLDFKNTLTGSTSVDVEKVWKDNGDLYGRRPHTINVILLKNGEETDTAELSKSVNWKHTFKDLPKYDDEGKVITYTVKEEKVEGYTVSVSGSAKDGFRITNTYVPEKIKISALKKWDDAGNKDGVRPDTVKVHLLADGRRIDSEVLSAENGWKAVFSDLPEYEGKRKISYSLSEDKVKDYTSTVTGSAEDGFVVTNTHKPDDEEENGGGDSGSGNGSGKRGSGKPGTGDSGNAVLWFVLMAAGMSSLGGLILFRRKRG